MSITAPQVHVGQCLNQGEDEGRSFQERCPRYEVKEVKGRFGPCEVGTVINVSMGGLALETGKYLQVGKSYALSLTGGHGTHDGSGTVVWCQLIRTVRIGGTEVAPVYRAGFKFDDLTVQQKFDLEAFVINEAEDEVARENLQRASG